MTIAPRRLIILAAAAALVVSACGGSDAAPADAPATTAAEAADTGSESTEVSESAATETTTNAAADGSGSDDELQYPTSTVPDLPAEYVGTIGPVDITGDLLPDLAEGADFASDAAVGTPAPVVLGVGFDGLPSRIDGASDGPTMVAVVAHWCPHCNDELDVFREMRDDGRFPDGLKVIAVSTAVNAGAPNFPPYQWLIDKDWTFETMMDAVDIDTGDFLVADAMGVTGFPFIVLIDGDGNVAGRWSGERDPDEIVAAFESQLGLG